MISKKTLKDYGFGSINDYYDYIIESKINGNFSRVKYLLKKLSMIQKNNFLEYVVNSKYNLDVYKYFVQLCYKFN